MTVAAIVVAAGRGSRFGGLKQFSRLGTLSVAAHSVSASRAVAAFVLLVVPEGYHGDGEGADVVVVGGTSRSASVRAGLQSLPDSDIVVVHDAARPLASNKLFEAVVDAVNSGADAAIPGVAISDTLKRTVSLQGRTMVSETLDRSELVAVQTPQAFRREVLDRAHATMSDATDDAVLVEVAGGTVVVIAGESQNFKITGPEDLALAAAMMGDLQ